MRILPLMSTGLSETSSVQLMEVSALRWQIFRGE